MADRFRRIELVKRATKKAGMEYTVGWSVVRGTPSGESEEVMGGVVSMDAPDPELIRAMEKLAAEAADRLGLAEDVETWFVAAEWDGTSEGDSVKVKFEARGLAGIVGDPKITVECRLTGSVFHEARHLEMEAFAYADLERRAQLELLEEEPEGAPEGI